MSSRTSKSSSIGTLTFLYFLLLLSTSVIVYTAVKFNSITYNQSLNYNNHLRYHIANSLFRQGTDLLTDSVRRYVVTMNPEFMKDYFREVREGRHRDRALRMIMGLQIDQALKETLINAMKESKGLMNSEYHAMHIIAAKRERDFLHRELGGCPFPADEREMSEDERHRRAEEMLWDDNYIRTKIRIYSHLSDGLENASLQASERHQQLRNELIRMLVLSAVSLIVLVLTVCGFIFYRRRQHERIVEEQAENNARMNAQLKKERDKSIQAERAKSYFFSTVSHDIRTPLNSIIGFSEMLHLGIEDPKEKQKALDAIITSAKTLLELINDVLDLSKLESGKMELHPVPTDIAALVDNVASSFEVAVSQKSIRLITEVGKMPLLKLDPQRIRQILFNLIGNAVKFTAQGSVTVRAAYDNCTFSLSVADTGCGISKEDISKLMSPYVQLRPHDSTSGTGLGLAICRQLSTQMRGTLDIESTLGQGTTFTLRIPYVQAISERETKAYLSEHNKPRPVTQLKTAITEKHVLIVDDQKLNLKILRTMLSRLGITRVQMAGNGKEALDVLENSGNVDIVLTDMSMPVMDGAGLVGEIRRSSRFSGLPVYVITADVEVIGKYGELGFDGMLIKPITLEKLKELLAKYSPEQPPSADKSADGAKG